VNRRDIPAIAVALLALVLAGWWRTSAGSTAPFTRGTIVRAVNGDTIIVRAGDRTEDVRLLGIDTPETVDPRRPVG
jgi:endonuclease YncB( thermonuclease family)